MTSSSLIKLRDYWLGARGDREMPGRGDIDPADIPRLLPNLSLIDVTYDPTRFRYRLIGTKITDMAGRDATGKWLDEELYGERTEDMLWAFRQVVGEKSPVAVREKIQFVDKSWVNVEALLLPLGNSDDRVDIVMTSVDTVGKPLVEFDHDKSYILDWRK